MKDLRQNERAVVGEGKVGKAEGTKRARRYLGCNTGAGNRVVDRLWEEKACPGNRLTWPSSHGQMLILVQARYDSQLVDCTDGGGGLAIWQA